MSTLFQKSFASGEISPSLYQRTDMIKYVTGARTVKNGFIKKSGGFTNRAGTSYVYGATALSAVGPYDDSGAAIGETTRLVKWDRLDGVDSYVLEFGNGFIRFYKNGAMVTVDGVASWANGTSYVVGDLVCVEGINYYCILAHNGHTPPNTTYWYALSGFEYSIPSPYTTAYLTDRGAFCTSQSSTEMKITHTSLLPRKLVRTSDTNWVMAAWNVDGSSPTRYGIPTIGAATITSVTPNGSGDQHTWVVCAVTEAGEEGFNSGGFDGDIPVGGTAAVIVWTAASFVTGYTGVIRGYNVYRRYVTNGDFFFVGFTTGLTYADASETLPDGDTPTLPVSRPELNTTVGTSGGFPKRVGTYQQRTLLGNFSFNTQASYASRTGTPQLFTRKFPHLDDDSILFQVNGAVRHFLDLGTLIVFSDTGEWIVDGNANGAITPTATFPKQFSYYVASKNLAPLIIGSEAIYVQANDSIIRTLGFDSIGGGKDGLRDDDLTAFADHLFEGFTIRSWDYQKNPHSIVWAVRDDGVLLGCSYIKNQQILAWHRHETDGLVEEVCCIQEGVEHSVYIIVAREINGATVRYMERLNSRVFDDIVDGVFVDSALTFDGRNTGSATMELTGGVTWDESETLSLRSSVESFSELEIGNEIWLTGDDDVVYRLAITAYTNPNLVSVTADKTIAAASLLRATATTSWARAADTIGGLDHLEGKEVSVVGDGYVVANPNNDQYGTPLTVTDGAITLPECYSVVHVGLPYISDLETLDVDTANGESIVGKKKLVTQVTMHAQQTRSFWVGGKPPTDDDTDPLEGLQELKIREAEDWATPSSIVTDVVDVIIENSWNSNGRVLIRGIDPLPFTILSVAPSGLFPFRNGGG